MRTNRWSGRQISGQTDNANTYLGEHVSFLSVQKKRASLTYHSFSKNYYEPDI